MFITSGEPSERYPRFQSPITRMTVSIRHIPRDRRVIHKLIHRCSFLRHANETLCDKKRMRNAAGAAVLSGRSAHSQHEIGRAPQADGVEPTGRTEIDMLEIVDD